MADSLDAQGSSALPPSPSEPSGGEQFDTVRQVSHAAGMSANYGRTTPIPERSAPSPWDAHDAEPLAPRAVVPAGCGCGGKSGVRQFVYAIGELGIDFGIRQRQDSLQEHFLGVVPSPDDRVPGPQGPRPHPAYPSDIGTYYNFLRYLLGYNFPARDPAGQPYTEAGNFISNGSLYDAASVYWVLKQGECPLYVIRPQGAFAEQAYKQLTVFLIEQLGLTRQDLLDLGIHTGCLEGFLKCYGGLQRDIFDPTPPSPPPLKPAPQAGHPKRREGRRREGAESAEAESAEAERTEELEAAEFTAMVDTGPAGHPFGPVDPLDIFGEDPRKASHIAIAGEVVGRVRLYTGEEVEVLDPALRGMSNWNTPQLILDILKYLGLIDPAATTLPPAPNQDQAYIIFLIVKVIAKLYDLVLNPGKDPADRARNYFATTQLMFAARTFMNPYFLSMLGATRVNFPTATPPPVPSQTFQADPEKLQNIVVDTLLAKSARCLRYGSMPFDVELSFYNFTNQFQGTVALAQTIDVSDIVPVASSKIRAYPVRR